MVCSVVTIGMRLRSLELCDAADPHRTASASRAAVQFGTDGRVGAESRWTAIDDDEVDDAARVGQETVAPGRTFLGTASRHLPNPTLHLARSCRVPWRFTPTWNVAMPRSSCSHSSRWSRYSDLRCRRLHAPSGTGGRVVPDSRTATPRRGSGRAGRRYRISRRGPSPLSAHDCYRDW